MPTRSRLTLFSILIGLLCWLPVGIYFWTVHRHAVDFFYADDFHLFKTIVWVKESTSWKTVVELFIQQHNEHRIVVPRLITWLDYWLEGHVNFRSLIFLGNLSWLGVLIILFQRYRTLNLPSLFYFLPIPFLLFQPQFSDNVTWAISGLQQTVIILLALLIITQLSKPKLNIGLAIALTVVATFTHGNGMFIFLVGIVLLSLRKAWKALGIWIGILACIVLFYFWNYQAGQNANIGGSLANPLRLLAGFFAFWGSLASVFSKNPMAAVVLGGLIFLLHSIKVVQFFGIYFQNKSRGLLPETTLFLVGCYVFFSITAGLVSLSRSWGGIESILMTRYAHYSPLLVSLCLLWWLPNLLAAKSRLFSLPTNQLISTFIFGFSLIFNALSYYYFTPELLVRQQSLWADSYNWKHHQTFLGYPRSFTENIKSVYQQAEQMGICQTPTPFEQLIAQPPSPTATIPVQLSRFATQDQDASGVYQRQYAHVEQVSLEPDNYLWLRSQEQPYLVSTIQKRASKKIFFTTTHTLGNGFSANLLTESLPKGEYQIAIVQLKNTKPFVFLTPQTLVIP
ncbi:MAG: hypothetical protein U0Y10_19980 [Spirosomataceae bacterium]